MDEQILLLTAESVGEAQRQVLMGREFLTFPAVLVRNQVLNNNLGRTLLPAEDMTPQWAQTFNGAPVVIDHPRMRGAPVSARDPKVLNQMGVGFVFDSRVEEDEGGVRAVKADVFLDPARLEEVSDLQAILERLDEGEPVELSTGFPVMVEEVSGVHNGEEYDIVLHPQGADHLAVFAEKIGACSVEDGCGVGVNEDPEPQGGWLMALFHRLFGDNQSDNDIRRILQSALIEEFGGEDRHIWIEDTFSDEGTVVFEIRDEDEADLWRTTFEIGEDGAVTLGEPERVRRVTDYEPVANDEADAGNDSTQEGEMNREEMIAELAEAGLDRESLDAMNDCQIRALHGATVEDAGEPEPVDRDEGAADNSDADAVEALLAEVREARSENESLRERLEALEETTAPAVQERENERTSLVEYLASNDRCPFDEDELRSRNLEELRKLRSMIRGENYAARGGPKVPATNEGDEPQFVAPTPYWQTNSDEGGEG